MMRFNCKTSKGCWNVVLKLMWAVLRKRECAAIWNWLVLNASGWNHEMCTLIKFLALVNSPNVVWRLASEPTGTISFNRSKQWRSCARLKNMNTTIRTTFHLPPSPLSQLPLLPCLFHSLSITFLYPLLCYYIHSSHAQSCYFYSIHLSSNSLQYVPFTSLFLLLIYPILPHFHSFMILLSNQITQTTWCCGSISVMGHSTRNGCHQI